MRLFLCCFIFVLTAAHTFAADKWIHATSGHFDMYAAENEADARAALQHLEAVRAFFVTSTHSQDPGGQPVRIVVFHSEGDFNKYRPAEYVAANAFPIAGDHATIVALGLKPAMYEKIFQEYCQLVMDESASRLPYWLRAGLAQFYSTLKPGENTMKLGGPPTRSYHVQGTGQVDLTQLVAIDRVSYLASRGKAAEEFGADTDHTTSHTSKALGKSTTALEEASGNVAQDFEGPDWTLTHMLMFGPDYRNKVSEFIAALGSGQDTGAAFNSVYGRSLGQVVVDLQLYMKQSSLAVVTRNFPYEKPAPPQVKPVTKEEQDGVFAEIGRKGK